MRRAFTAIELAVVLVIIAILAVMLLPALEHGRHQARRAKCLSRVRQVGLAIEMYHSAYDGQWPDARRSVSPENPDWPDPTGSLAALYPGYATKPFLFQCPATEDTVLMSPDELDFMNCENFFVSPEGRSLRSEDEGKGPPRPPSYFFDGGGAYGRRIPRNAKPTRVVYGDECINDLWTSATGEKTWIGENNHPLGGGNFLFADKHAEWLRLQWTGDPFEKRNSLPYIPNPHIRKAPRFARSSNYSVWVDTSVFWDDHGGRMREVDADLAGMMWVDGSWKEF
jgi:prepilin-type N-terminal cleavage/methylation domain-containing protein